MRELAWHIGKALENWGIELQAWADPHRTTRDADNVVKQVCLQNIERVKQQVRNKEISESEGERRISELLNSYNQISNRLWQESG